MVAPRAVLMCPPDEFDVVDIKNPFMEGNLGAVDRMRARAQWDALRAAFESAGMPVETVEPIPGCEDMTFAANQTLPGVHPDGRRVCVLSRMKHASRRREVPAYGRWFAARGYDVLDPLPDGCVFEGCGDAIWHPDRHELWVGHGHRTEHRALAVVARAFDAPVRSLELVDPRFYHLDTCLCALDEGAALVFKGAFHPDAFGELQAGYDRLLEVAEDEAVNALACNATALPSGHVVIDQRAVRTVERLDAEGYRPVPVDTGEFLKSGGSVYCLKQFVY